MAGKGRPVDLLPIPPQLRGVRLLRLDVACDFKGIRDVQVWLDIMRSSRHLDPPWKGYSSSVMLRTGKAGWCVVGYDKSLESSAKRTGVAVPTGTFRVEVRLIQTLMSREGLRSLGDISPTQCLRLFAKGFSKAGLDRPVGGQKALRRNRLQPLTRLKTARLYEHLDAAAVGLVNPCDARP